MIHIRLLFGGKVKDDDRGVEGILPWQTSLQTAISLPALSGTIECIFGRFSFALSGTVREVIAVEISGSGTVLYMQITVTVKDTVLNST